MQFQSVLDTQFSKFSTTLKGSKDFFALCFKIFWASHTENSFLITSDKSENQLQKRELAIIYQNKQNFGHTEAGLRGS